MKYDEKIEKLRQRIIMNCGEKHLMHEELKESQIPRYESWIDDEYGTKVFYYENVTKRKSGNKATEWDHYDDYEVDLFYCDYTLYICPYLVYFLDSLVEEENLTIIFNIDFTSVPEFLTVEVKIVLLKNKIDESQATYVSEKEKKLDELNKKYKSFNKKNSSISNSYEELQELIENIKNEISSIESKSEIETKVYGEELEKYMIIRNINKHQEPSTNYFYELVELIEFKLVDTINISDIDRINEFFASTVIEPQKRLVL